MDTIPASLQEPLNALFEPIPPTVHLDQPVEHDPHAYFGSVSTLVLELQGSAVTFEIEPQQYGNMVVIGRADDSRPGLIDLDLCRHTGGQFGVSRQHLMITYSPDMQLLTVMDLNSTNGSWVNNQRLYVGMSRVVRHGDVLRMGKMTLVVTLLDAVSDMDLI